MMRTSIYIILVLFVCSCETKKKEENTTNFSLEKTEQMGKSDDDSIQIIPIDTLQLDWFSIKQDYRFLNCGARISNEKKFLKEIENDAQFYYEYCAHNGNQDRLHQRTEYASEAKLLETIVLKSEIGQYDDPREELVFLQSQISSSSFGTLDLVGKTKEQAIDILGTPHYDSLQTLCYSNDQKLLFLRYDVSLQITSFKYYPNSKLVTDLKSQLPLLKW